MTSLCLLWPLACANRSAFKTSDHNSAEGGAAGASSSGTAGETSASGGASGSTSTGGSLGAAGADGAGGQPTVDCSVDDDCAIFVAVGGTGAGTRDNPAGSVTDGVVLATSTGKSYVFVCAGDYVETITVSENEAPLVVRGGFDCETWGDGETTKVVPATGHTAFEVTARETVFDRLSFEVTSSVPTSWSAIGGYVTDADMTLRRVMITAGDGKGGTFVDNVPLFTLPNPILGTPATANAPGGASTVTCPAGDTTTGGAGATKGVAGTGQTGAPNYPGAGGEGGPTTSASSCSVASYGVSGADAPPAAPGPGAVAIGKLVADRWQGETGGVGEDGKAGQGGGGSGATSAQHGQGGGTGGCGGKRGRGGPPGGSSIGLVSVRSVVRLENTTITTGAGGLGGTGQLGQLGKTGANPSPVSSGYCLAGKGGSGARGGAGGGGAGGISVPVVYTSDSTITQEDTTLTPGTAGAKGVGGVPGTNDGVAGVAQATLEL
jgi:hypothetical protein